MSEWQMASWCVGLHPLVCSLIAESHLLHEIIRFVWTTTMDMTKKPKEEEKWSLKKENVQRFHSCHKTDTVLPSICVRDRVRLPSFYLVEEGGEDPPGLPQLITGTERGAVQSQNIQHKNKIPRQWSRTVNGTTNLRTKCIWFPQKTSSISLSYASGSFTC